MNKQFAEIARRKQRLVDQCAGEREELAAALMQVRSSFSFSALLATVGRTLKPYPVLVTGISGLLASGYAGMLLRSSGKLLRLGQAVLPLWYWWNQTRRSD